MQHRCTVSAPSHFIALIFVLLCSPTLFAQTYTSVQSGDWYLPSTWGTSTIPGTGSDIVISAGHTVRLNENWSNWVIKSIIIQSTAHLRIVTNGILAIGHGGLGRYFTVDGELSIEGTGILICGGVTVNINGSFSVSSPGGGMDGMPSELRINSNASMTMSDGEVYCRNLQVLPAATLYYDGGLGITVESNAAINGALTSTSTLPGTTVLDVGSTLSVGGVLDVGATSLSGNYTVSSPIVLSSGSNIRYVRSGNQSIDPSLSYRNLTLMGSGDKNLTANLSILDQFHIKGNARFVNANNTSVTCGSNLIDSSTCVSPHAYGTGSYTFTGTTLGGTNNMDFTGSTITFSGAQVTLGDGLYGNANITFGTVHSTNVNTSIVLGAGAYSGAITISGAFNISGTNATLSAMGGTLSLASLNLSGGNSVLTLQNAGTTVSGNLSCANNAVINATSSVGGYIEVQGNLDIDAQTTVTGTTTVDGAMRISGSGSGVNTFNGTVTVNGAFVEISAGSTLSNAGFTHSTTAIGSSCTIGGAFTTGATAPVNINAENVLLFGTPAFYSLSVSNSSGMFSSLVDFSISNTATFAKDLNMNGNTLTFLPSAPRASLHGNGEVLGTVRRTLEASGSYTFTGAYSTLLAPVLAMPTDFEFTLVKSAPDQQAVMRYYDIRRVHSDFIPDVQSFTLGLQYKDAELNGNDDNTLLICYGEYGIAGEDDFEKLLTSSVNTNARIVTYVFDGIMSFEHRYTLADVNAPLPVELVAFTARARSGNVELRWTTATELNNYGFEIERSLSSSGEFSCIGFVQGHGSKATPSEYRFIDENPPARSVFYRLKQMDRDGDISYGPVVEVSPSATAFELNNHPNPFNPSTNISFVAPNDGPAVLRIYSMSGELLAEPFASSVSKGERVVVPFHAGDLPGGTYFYRLHAGETVANGKMLLVK